MKNINEFLKEVYEATHLANLGTALSTAKILFNSKEDKALLDEVSIMYRDQISGGTTNKIIDLRKTWSNLVTA